MVARITPRIVRNSKINVFYILVLLGVVLLFSKIILNKKSNVIVVTDYEKIVIPVPKNKIIMGTKLEKTLFKNIEFPKNSLPKDIITDIENYKDYIFVENVSAELPINLNSIKETNTLNPVLESIPEGMRAISLKVDAITSVEGWAQSGSYVDVLLTEKSQTVVIAEKVKVISVERKTDIRENNNPTIPNTITLLVDQEQCLAINLGLSKGKLSFALRSSSDSQSWNNKNLLADKLGRVSGVNSSKGKLTIGKKTWQLVNSDWIKVQ